MKKLYKDCQQDYEKNLDDYLSTKDNKYLQNIFIDFKTYCFNKIRKMRSFLPTETINDWATEVTINVFNAIKKKGINKRDSWPKNMGAYLGLCCLDINNIKKYSRESIEIPSELNLQSEYYDNNEESLFMIDDKTLDMETLKWVIDEAVKMTVYNDGYKMVDVDRTMKLLTKYNGKINKFSEKYTAIKDALYKNLIYVMNMKGANNNEKDFVDACCSFDIRLRLCHCNSRASGNNAYNITYKRSYRKGKHKKARN